MIPRSSTTTSRVVLGHAGWWLLLLNIATTADAQGNLPYTNVPYPPGCTEYGPFVQVAAINVHIEDGTDGAILADRSDVLAAFDYDDGLCRYRGHGNSYRFNPIPRVPERFRGQTGHSISMNRKLAPALLRMPTPLRRDCTHPVDLYPCLLLSRRPDQRCPDPLSSVDCRAEGVAADRANVCIQEC